MQSIDAGRHTAHIGGKMGGLPGFIYRIGIKRKREKDFDRQVVRDALIKDIKNRRLSVRILRRLISLYSVATLLLAESPKGINRPKRNCSSLS